MVCGLVEVCSAETIRSVLSVYLRSGVCRYGPTGRTPSSISRKSNVLLWASSTFQPVMVFSIVYVTDPPALVWPLLQVIALLAQSARLELFWPVDLEPPPLQPDITSSAATPSAARPTNRFDVRMSCT